MQYAVKDGQNIFDIVLKTISNIENTYALLQANPHIDSIDFDFNDNPNLKIDYTPPPSKTPLSIASNVGQDSSVASIQGRDEQSIFDICVLTTNSIETIFKDLILPNNISNVNDQNLRGKHITFEKNSIQDIPLYNYMSKKATGVSSVLKFNTGALLQENGFYILQENGGKLLL